MFSIEIYLPVVSGRSAEYDRVKQQLTERYGGLTIYSRAPAEGIWKPDGQGESHDRIVIFEVLAEELERDWWSRYRQTLEQIFTQQEILIRAAEVTRL